MAGAEVTAGLQLLNGIITQLKKEKGVTFSFARHACSAVLSRPPLVVIAGSPGVEQQLIADTSENLLDKVGRLVAKGSKTEQALMIHILAACMQSCSSVSLLEKAVGWGSQLTEAIRRSEAGTPAETAAPVPIGAAALAQAACAAAAVLFGRLHLHIELPGVRREATSIVPKLLPQLLSLLQNAQQLTSSCQVAALQLLAALLRCVPTALRSAATMAERAVQQIVLTALASTAGIDVPGAVLAAQRQVLAQVALCAALLPAVQGDAATWSEAARKLLSSSHDVLDYLLMGLEGRPMDPHYRSYLAPTAADAQSSQQQPAVVTSGWLPSLPWQQQQQQQGTAASRRQTTPAQLLLSMCIAALQHLVQQPFAAPVPVPSYSLALLAARLLHCDAGAAVAAGAVAGSSTMYQEVLVLQPQLQQAGWQLLQLVVDAAGQQLQLQGLLLRVVRQGLRGVQLSGRAALLCRSASVRCCIYATASQLLLTTGLAGARALAEEAIGCAVLELYAVSAATASPAGGVMLAGSKGGQRPVKRAKTAGGASGNEFEQFDPASSAAAVAAGDDVHQMACASDADLAAQAAALQLLRALLEAGGQLLPPDVRAHVDAVAYHIAQTATAAALRLRQQPALTSSTRSGSSALGSMQAAAYETMLASLLVPCSHRPPFLSQGALLLRHGRNSTNPAVAAVCQAAAIQVEALLHPHVTSMSSVRQYAGMDTVQPLTKPCMWSSVDAAAGQASAVGARQDTAVVAGSQKQPHSRSGQKGAFASGGGSSAAAVAAAANGDATDSGLVVVGYPVNLPNTQQPQQQPRMHHQAGTGGAEELQQRHNQGTAPAHIAAAGLGSAAMDAGVPEQQRQQAAQPVQQHPEQVGLIILHSSHLPGSSVPAGGVGAEGAPAPSPPAAFPLVAPTILVSAGKIKADTAVFDAESSDSEGPLPDIDSGTGSSDDQQDD